MIMISTGTEAKKHHYIPRFYLRGFTNEEGEFYVFDRAKQEIRKSKPDNSFYEKYRNTGFAKDKDSKTNLLEDMYSHYDNRAAKVFEDIRNSKLNDPILTPFNLTILRLFIINLFWRIPSNDKLLSELIDRSSFKELGFDFINKSSGEGADRTLQTQIKSIDSFRKMYRMIVPFLSSNKNYSRENYNQWRLLYRPQEFNLTGDNPVILYSFKDFSSLNEELLFPISKNIMICCTEKKVPPSLPPKFNLLLDIFTILKSERFVCCKDKNYLDMIVNRFYGYANGKNLERHIIEDIFGYFE